VAVGQVVAGMLNHRAATILAALSQAALAVLILRISIPH